jgi:SAM-dependent methyltransferase
MDSTKPDFWEQRYLSGRTPWDFQGVPPALVDFLRRTPGTGSVLLPGCGTGYEVRAFHESGWRPLAIDFSPAAVKHAREVLGLLAPSVRQADFFVDDLGGPYDLIYERTFLCSLPPDRWPDYINRMANLLRPGGVLAGLFYYGSDPEGPPFPLDATRAGGLFAPFDLRIDRAVPAGQSLPLFAGLERWQEWHLKPA